MEMERQAEVKMKVLLVEDEEIILQSLYKVVDWESLGYSVCGMARRYDEAVAIARRERPDLMISDIMLGGEQNTGLDLVRLFHGLLPKMWTILLTGYDSFEFAKDAIGYTVKAYLLKPLDIQTLTKHLREFREAFLLRRAEENRRAFLNRQIENAKPFLFDWLTSYADQEAYDRTFGRMEAQAGWQSVVIAFRERIESQATYELFLQIEEVCNYYKGAANPFFNRSHFIVVLRMEEANRLCAGGNLNEFVQRLQDFLDFQDIQNYVLCVGEFAASLPQLRESYQQACALAEYGRFVGNDKQVYYTDIAAAPRQQFPRLRNISMQLRVAMQTGGCEEAVALVCGGMQEAAEKGASVGILKSLAYEALVILDEIKALVGLEQNLGQIPEWARLDRCDNLEEMLECLSDNYRALGAKMTAQKDDRIDSALEQIKRIIDEDFAKDLSLNGFANQVFISPAYLSTMFSERYGVTFKNYLVGVRMEAAKKLLAQGDQKVYTVAEQVGYVDTRYFSQVFRKYTGYTPICYREMMRAGGEE